MHIKVHIKADTKREKVTKDQNGRLMIDVREPAKRNLAKVRVREIVAQTHDVSVGKTRIISGYRSPSKIISIS